MNKESEDKINITVYQEELKNIIKKYKKVKKYMKSNLYAVQCIDGTETYVSNLLKDLRGETTE
jgi:hypothetical protein